jgi:bifunctional isochorismate lyase/aryl carrier protein
MEGRVFVTENFSADPAPNGFSADPAPNGFSADPAPNGFRADPAPNGPNGIPRILPYSMPTVTPSALVPWQPHPDRCVLLLHDLQHYFLDRFPPAPLAELVVNVSLLRATARRLAIPVWYTAQPGGVDRATRGLLHDFWGPGMGTDESSRGIVAALAPEPGDLVISKLRYSAFHATPLADELARHGRDQIILCGVFAHIGVLLTAVDAFSRNIETFLVADAVADFSAADHLAALEYAAGRCAVVATTRATLAVVEQSARLVAR